MTNVSERIDLFRPIARDTYRLWAWLPSFLCSAEDIAAYLDADLEDGDPALVVAVLGDIARARGMTQLAREAGVGRESLYKALSASGNPEFATVMKIVRALGLRFQVQPLQS